MKAQDRKWLALIELASKPSHSMYRGEREDLIPPAVLRRLEQSGYVERHSPRNLAHKDRIAITSEGQSALAAE